MGIKDVLLVLTGYPQPTSGACIDQAVSTAARLGAAISAVSLEIDVQLPGGGNFLASRLLNLSGLLAEEQRKSITEARRLAACFEQKAAQAGVLQDVLVEHCTTAQAAGLLTDHARLRDLTIIPIRAGDRIERGYAESVIFGAGRPVLVVPDTDAPGGSAGLSSIAVAWDFGRPAARALADALPLLKQAGATRVVTVTSETQLSPARSHERLAGHLKTHGIEAEFDQVDARGRPVGEVLQGYAASQRIDLLVMGAYGHSRLRDFVLGGATRSMLLDRPVPLFLSH